MSTDQLDALKQAASDEARFPVSAGRAALHDMEKPTINHGARARTVLVSGLSIGLVTSGVASLLMLRGYGQEVVAISVFFAAVIMYLILNLTIKVYKSS